MNTPTVERIAAVSGPENAILWPTPTLPGTTMLTFRGYGNGSTEPFVLSGDAAVRIAAERGPFALRVVRPDGTDAVNPASMPFGGLGLGAILEGGTYALEVKTPERWGVTIVFDSPE